MSTERNIAKQMFDEKFEEGGEISLDDFIADVEKQGGEKMVASGSTVENYADDLAQKGVLKLNLDNPCKKIYRIFNGKLEMLLKESYDASLNTN